MFIVEIEELLRNAMGLDAASLGRETVRQAVRIRLEQCGFQDGIDYLEHVRQSAKRPALDELRPADGRAQQQRVFL